MVKIKKETTNIWVYKFRNNANIANLVWAKIHNDFLWFNLRKIVFLVDLYHS